ncbi:MAG: hypothetical protein ACREED_10305 [Stellaceae bacterium]
MIDVDDFRVRVRGKVKSHAQPIHLAPSGSFSIAHTAELHAASFTRN